MNAIRPPSIPRLGLTSARTSRLPRLDMPPRCPTYLQRHPKGTPDPGWDFEPDTLRLKQGTILSAVDQGGEPHTFTEVAQFGGGFVDGLNHGEAVVPECTGGFSNLAVAKTRILQGSHIEVTGLSKGEHRFQCCIHPWMRVTVEVKGRGEK